MLVYLILITIIVIFGYELKADYYLKKKKEFILLSFILLTCISGFRSASVGSDTQTYIRIFNAIANDDSFNSRFEYGFIIYLRLISHFSKNPQILLVISSAICVGSVCYFVYYHSKKPTISILLYILLGSYFSQMNTMRQAIAISFALLGFSLLLREKIFLASILLAVSVTFHTVGIVSFVPFFICLLVNNYRKSLKNGRYWVRRVIATLIVVSLVCFIFYEEFLNVVFFFFDKYTGYLSGIWNEENYFASVLSTLVSLVFFIVGAIYLKKEEFNSERLLAMLMLMFNILFGVLSIKMEFWSRVTGMFGIYTALLWVPEFLTAIPNGKNRIFVTWAVFISSLVYMLVILVYRPEWTMVTPYHLWKNHI